MTRDDDLIRRLEDYLDEYDGTTPLPERVRDALHAALPRTRQASARRGPLGVLTMASASSTVRLGVAAAAVVAAVVLGAAVLNGSRGDLGVGGPAPTKAPGATPAVTPTPAAPGATSAATVRPLSSADSAPCHPDTTVHDCIAPGTYSLTGTIWPAEVTLEVPAGWFVYYPGVGHQGVLVDSGSDAPDGSGWGVMISLVGSVSRDPCDADAGTHAPEDTDTAAELVAAIGAWPGFDATEPRAVTVDGANGLLVEVTSTRTEADCASQAIWRETGLQPVDAYPMIGEPAARRGATFRILEVGDRLLAIRTTEFGDPSPHEVSQGVAPDPSRHAADLVELQAIVDSIRLEPWPAE